MNLYLMLSLRSMGYATINFIALIQQDFGHDVCLLKYLTHLLNNKMRRHKYYYEHKFFNCI